MHRLAVALYYQSICLLESHRLRIYRPDVRSGSALLSRPINFGIDGPNISRSNKPTRGLRFNWLSLSASATARFAEERIVSRVSSTTKSLNALATVLFPTPPLPLATTTTFLTFGILRFTGGPVRRGITGAGARWRGRPYLRDYIRGMFKRKTLIILTY